MAINGPPPAGTTLAAPVIDWRALAACRDADPDQFFPVGDSAAPAHAAQVARAKRVCASCPVGRECLLFAAGEKFGIWGGTTPEERHTERRRRLRSLRRAAA